LGRGRLVRAASGFYARWTTTRTAPQPALEPSGNRAAEALAVAFWINTAEILDRALHAEILVAP
jgi:hypothetical protein